MRLVWCVVWSEGYEDSPVSLGWVLKNMVEELNEKG